VIIECAGLPGGGKTTICNLVMQPHGKRGAIRFRDIVVNPALMRASWKILLLCYAARPLTFARLKRGAKFIVFLRYYQHRKRAVLLDQGQVQKLWSLLVDARHYPALRLQEVMAALTPFAPDWLVWIETPLDEAVNRLTKRTHGKSRYDRLPEASTRELLSARANLLKTFAREYTKMTKTNFLELDGALDPAENAAKIDAILDA
jgi:AAA domain